MRDAGERSLCRFGRTGRLDRGLLGLAGRTKELCELDRELTSPCLQLEQHRFGGLARKPELASLRIEAETFRRNGRRVRGEQLAQRHDG